MQAFSAWASPRLLSPPQVADPAVHPGGAANHLGAFRRRTVVVKQQFPIRKGLPHNGTHRLKQLRFALGVIYAHRYADGW